MKRILLLAFITVFSGCQKDEIKLNDLSEQNIGEDQLFNIHTLGIRILTPDTLTTEELLTLKRNAIDSTDYYESKNRLSKRAIESTQSLFGSFSAVKDGTSYNCTAVSSFPQNSKLTLSYEWQLYKDGQLVQSLGGTYPSHIINFSLNPTAGIYSVKVIVYDRPYSPGPVIKVSEGFTNQLVLPIGSPPIPNNSYGAAPLYRYYNGQDHFYTTNWFDIELGGRGYHYERSIGYIYKTQQTGTSPLYRYYNSTTTNHFYTDNWNELGNGKNGYVFERIEGYIYKTQKPGTVPVYRYHHTQNGSHFYTDNWEELENGANGYVFERILCYVYEREQ